MFNFRKMSIEKRKRVLAVLSIIVITLIVVSMIANFMLGNYHIIFWQAMVIIFLMIGMWSDKIVISSFNLIEEQSKLIDEQQQLLKKHHEMMQDNKK